MSDRFHSEDDAVEHDTVETGTAEEGTAESGAEAISLIRPVSEPPAPGAPRPHGPSVSPPGEDFDEWMRDWEDIRPEGLGSHPGATAPEQATGAETTPAQPLVGEEPTEPNPALQIPSPPPVRSSGERSVPRPRLVRASRPRPVSAATESSPSKASTVAGTASFVWDRDSSVSVDADGFERDGTTTQARQTTSRTVHIGGLDVTVDATQRAMLVTAAIGMVVVAGLFASLLSGLGDQTDAATRQPDSEIVADTVPPDLNVSANSPAGPSVSDLAQATVRIAGLDDDGATLCAGSGVLVGEGGVILTNAHVVTADDDCPFTTIAVGVTLDTSDPPALRYRGEVLVVDDVLDLAVVNIVGVLSSDDPLEINPNFPTAVLGDSDQVDLGDNIRILGYPVIGGETITQTTGSVAGFVTEEGVGNRALMKTDASISAGNSGGMAVNAAGEVIGIPTRAGANELGPPVDCREVSDTNNDGRIDTDDNCVPIGGFLNSVRPINLARDLLSRAEAVQQDAGPSEMTAGPLDLSEVSIWNPRFSTGEENDNPVDEVITLAEGVEEICLFVDWDGIPNGVQWAAVWSHDGMKINEFTIFKVWEFGEEGRNFWYCAEDRRGHPAGVYEVGIFLNNQLAFVESIEVTETAVETFEVTWVNKTEQDICGLAVNPLALSRHAGVNVLSPGETLRPGESAVIELPAGQIVVEAYDCSGMAIAAELDGLSIPESLFVDDQPVPLVIGGSAPDVSDADSGG